MKEGRMEEGRERDKDAMKIENHGREDRKIMEMKGRRVKGKE